MIGDIDDELDVGEWINSAQEDLGSIELMSRIPYLAITCYHCQQAVEKILKAYLIANTGKPPEHKHDLIIFLKQCTKYSADFDQFNKICANISTFATIRYPPNKTITEENMKLTIINTYKIVDFTVEKLKQLGHNTPPRPPSEIFKKMIEAAESAKKHTYPKTPN